MKYDDRYSDRTWTFENPGSYKNESNRPIYNTTPEVSAKNGFGEYYITNYKKNDTTLRVGINITF